MFNTFAWGDSVFEREDFDGVLGVGDLDGVWEIEDLDGVLGMGDLDGVLGTGDFEIGDLAEVDFKLEESTNLDGGEMREAAPATFLSSATSEATFFAEYSESLLSDGIADLTKVLPRPEVDGMGCSMCPDMSRLDEDVVVGFSMCSVILPLIKIDVGMGFSICSGVPF